MGEDIMKRSVAMLMTKGAEFRIIACAMKEFGKIIKGNKNPATYWIDRDKYAWFPKTYAKETTGWKDSFSSDGKFLDEEWIKDAPHKARATKIDFDNTNVAVAVFAKDNDRAPFIFKGVYRKIAGFNNAPKRRFEWISDTLDTTLWQVKS
jgi:hypothetical protein